MNGRNGTESQRFLSWSGSGTVGRSFTAVVACKRDANDLDPRWWSGSKTGDGFMRSPRGSATSSRNRVARLTRSERYLCAAKRILLMLIDCTQSHLLDCCPRVSNPS